MAEVSSAAARETQNSAGGWLEDKHGATRFYLLAGEQPRWTDGGTSLKITFKISLK